MATDPPNDMPPPAPAPPPPGPGATREEWRAWRRGQRHQMYGQWPGWYGPWGWGARGRPWFWGAALILIGGYFLLQNLGLLDWLRGDVLWPTLLILLGIGLLISRSRDH